MKRTLALLLALALLTGCGDNAQTLVETSEQTMTEAAETVEQATTEAVETVEQTTTAITTAASIVTATTAPNEEIADPQQEYTAPLFTNNDELWRVSEDYSHASLTEQIGYDTPVDITQLYDYEYARKYAESFPEELYEQAVSQNYSSIYYSEIYVGSDSADWLCCAMYMLNVDMPDSGFYYTKLFYVNDGAVTEYLMQGEYGYCTLKYDYTGENIIIATGNGLYSLSRSGGEPVKLTDTLYFCKIHYISDEYMLYSDRDDVVEVYYFDTGENFMTDIYYGYQDRAPQCLIGDSITYMNYGSKHYRSFDILSREYTDNAEPPSNYGYSQSRNDEYIASVYGHTVKISGRLTDTSKQYDFDGLHTGYVELLGFYEGLLYLNSYSYGDDLSYLIVLDVQTDRAQIFLLDEDEKVLFNFTEYMLDPLTGKAAYYSDKNDTAGILEYLGGKPLTRSDGTLTDTFTARCMELIDPYKLSQYNVLPDLWDFDRDGVPELVMIYHDSNEGNQTAKVYDVASGECIGEFSGYNRDGYTRFSYDGEDTLVHSFYDAGDFRCDRWDKLCAEDGSLSITDSELKTAEFNGVSFNWNDSDNLHYSSHFEWCVCGGLESKSRRAEEYALFEYQSMVNMDNAEILPLLTEKYNSVLALKAAADKLENVIGFYPDDYNNDGKPEAFVQADGLYFINSSFEVTKISEYSGYENYKVEDSLVLQMLSNGRPCEVWSVSADGVPVRNEAASMFMCFDLSEHDSAVYAGFDSAYDGNAVGGHHTWKPYYFVLDGNGDFVPLVSKEITAQYLVSEYGEAAQNTLDEITAMGGEVTQIYTCGYGRTMFININYIIPEIIPTIDNDGNETEFCLRHQRYITLKVNGRYIFELERGDGHYTNYNNIGGST